MTKIAVIVDSSAALPQTIKNSYSIFEVSIPIIFGEETFMGGKDLQTVEQLLKVIEEKKLPGNTSQPSPAQWEAALTQAKDAGYEEALIITLSSGISGAYNTACLVAESFEGLNRIEVVDSKLINMAAGDQAILASKMSEAGKTMDEVLAAIENYKENLGVRLVVNDISHLKRTGRLSRGQALVGGLLNIKPVLTFDIPGDGKIAAIGKARKMSGAKELIQEAFEKYLAQADYPVRSYILDANDKKVGDKWMKDFQAKYPAVTFERGALDPVVAVHTGDKSMAIIWARDYNSYLD
ncbi:DegV family protein [Fructobacillus sp. M2-14]|uniref:DegV family protein n=1 Tax=Fructobacillus broussonetiae TaxID=2713173 RepID=A0ABS5R224_9LACO|nr:DegV family protein [Fructobacillus broussonetiae]MBS9338701.1 DegV family protein [Fructobacillus broussonetiae]